MNLSIGIKVCLITFFCVFIMGSTCLGVSEFTRDPILLVDPAASSFHQAGVQVAFDYLGNSHAVWIDPRSGSSEVWGTTLLGDGALLNNYLMYNPIGGESFTFSSIQRSIADVNSMYIMSVDGSTGNLVFVPSTSDLSSLPAIPAVTNDDSPRTSGSTTMGVISVISAGSKMIYAMGYAGTILVSAYDVSNQTWDTIETIISPPANTEYSHPQLAVDEADYIYMVYDRHNTSTGAYDIVARRSQDPGFAEYWELEAPILSIPSTFGYHDPEIAVCGSTGGSDLMVAITYLDPDPSMTNVWYDFEFNGVWTDATWMGTTPFVVNGDNSSLITVQGPESAYDADKETLYITWADNRAGSPMDIYMATVTGTGYTVNPEKKLTQDADIQQRPFIATGPQPGTVAIAYIRDDAGADSPYLLITQAEFFDSCDVYPPPNWNSYAGITQVTTPNYSPNYSYQLATTGGRGSLLRDYGVEEQTGSISLQFYDSMAVAADFAVIINNANQRGVIRMLGVRNDTTQSNYAYSFDGTVWQDTGVARDLGWHEISVAVASSGMTMQIEDDAGGGFFTTISDPTFTSFTSIEIQGGDDGEPYFIDDIRVEANPVVSATPRPVPATSVGALLLLMGAIGVLIRRRK